MRRSPQPQHLVLAFSVIILLLHRSLAVRQIPSDDSWLMWNFYQKSQSKLTYPGFTGELVGEFSVPSIFLPYKVLDFVGLLNYPNLLTVNATTFVGIGLALYILMIRYSVRSSIAAPISILFLSAELRTEFFSTTVTWQHLANVLYAILFAFLFDCASKRAKDGGGGRVLHAATVVLLATTFALREPAIVFGLVAVPIYAHLLLRTDRRLALPFLTCGFSHLLLAVLWRVSEPGTVMRRGLLVGPLQTLADSARVDLKVVAFANIFLLFFFFACVRLIPSRETSQLSFDTIASKIWATSGRFSRRISLVLILVSATYKWTATSYIITLVPSGFFLLELPEGARTTSPTHRWLSFEVDGVIQFACSVIVFLVLFINRSSPPRVYGFLGLLLFSEYAISSIGYAETANGSLFYRHGIYLVVAFCLLLGLGLDDWLSRQRQHWQTMVTFLSPLIVLSLAIFIPSGLSETMHEFDRIEPLSLHLVERHDSTESVGSEIWICPNDITNHWLLPAIPGTPQASFPPTRRTDLEVELSRLGRAGVRDLLDEEPITKDALSACWEYGVLPSSAS